MKYLKSIKSILTKELVINIYYNSLNNFLGVLIPIFVQYHIVRTLNFENLGEINTLLALQSWALLFSTSSQWFLISKISRKSDEKSISLLITNYLFYSLLLNSILTLIIFVYFKLFSNINFLLLTISSLGILFATLGSDYFYQATLKNKILFKRKLFIKFLFLISVYLLINDNNDFILYYCLIISTIIAESTISFSGISKFFRINYLNIKIVKGLLKVSLKLMIFNISYGILPTMLILLLPYFCNPFQIGLYTTILKLFTLITGFITSIAIIFLPNSIKYHKNNYPRFFLKSTLLTFYASLSVGLMILLFKKLIVFLFLNNSPIDWNNFIFLILYVITHSLLNHIIFNYYVKNNQYSFLIKFNIIVLLIFGFSVYLFRYNFPIMSALFYPSLVGLIILIRRLKSEIDILKIFN